MRPPLNATGLPLGLKYGSLRALGPLSSYSTVTVSFGVFLHLTRMKSPVPPSIIWHSTDSSQTPPAAPSSPTQCSRTPLARAAFARFPHVLSPHLNSTT